MKFIADHLEKLDGYFATKSETQKWLYVIIIAGVIAYIGYDLISSYAEERYNSTERVKNRLLNSINENTTYLEYITKNGDKDYKVKQDDQKISNKKKEILKVNNKIHFLDNKLMGLSDMLFNEKSWSKFLNSITSKAKIHNVDLRYIDNKYADSNGSFGHVLEIAVGVVGSYKDTVKFINELEQNVLVTDIFETKFIYDANTSSLQSDINISVWGINH